MHAEDAGLLSSEPFHYPVGTRVLGSPEEFAREFLPDYRRLDSIGPRGPATLDLLFRHVSDENAACLDYGCGIGLIPYHIAKARPRWRVVGWEGDHSSYEIARRYFGAPNLTFERKPYREYAAFETPAFDVIAFLEVIEHVDNPGEVLDGFQRGLRPGGMLLLSTPNVLGYNTLSGELRTAARLLLRPSPHERISRQLNQRPYDPTTNDGHVAVYSLPTLARLLDVHGFDVVSFAFAPVSRQFLRRLFPETLIVLARKRA